jgi:SPP1 family predicted phage head-tail adaptor
MMIGQLRERVTFQKRGPDADGQPLGAWIEPGLSVRACVIALKGREPVLQARLQGVQPVEITVRASDQAREVTDAWRVTWRGQIYNINSIAPDPQRTWIVVLAEADTTDA